MSKNRPPQEAGLRVAGHEPGQNTPVETVEEVRPQGRELEEEFSDHFLNLAKTFGQEDRPRDHALFLRGITNQRMYEGDHYGYYNPLTRRWHSKPIQRNDPFYPVNKFRYYSDGITTQHTQARINCQFIPCSDDDHDVSAARFAKSVGDYYESKIYTESFLQEEGKNGQFFGDEYSLSYWDPNAGPLVDRPVYEPREGYSDPGAYQCAQCGQSGTLDDALMLQGEQDEDPRCIRCGSSNLNVFEVDSLADLPVVTGYEKVPVGDLDCRLIPSPQVKFDTAGGHFDRALYIKREFRLRWQVIEDLFPFYDHRAATQGGSSGEDSVEAMDVVESGTGNSRTRGARGSDAERIVCQQWWYLPALYSRYKLPKDVRQLDGYLLRQGCWIKDYYPDGMYMFVVGGKAIDFRNENPHDHWNHCRFILVPNRAHGDGIEDMVRPQQELNNGRSLRIAHVEYNASPPTIIRDPLKEGDYTGNPKSIVHAKGLPGSSRLDMLAYQMPVRPLDQNVNVVVETAENDLQQTSKALPSSMGMTDPNELGGQRTAHGLQLMSDNSTSLRSPELALRAEGNAKRLAQWLKLFKNNAVEARYIPFRSKQGQKAGEWFKGSDIDADYLIVAKRGSWIPKSRAQRQNDLANALGVGQGMVLNPQVPPEWRQLIIDEFDIDIVLNDFEIDANLARRRMDKMSSRLTHAVNMAASIVATQFAGDAAGQQIAPQQKQQAVWEVAAELLCEMVPLIAGADTHPVHIKWLQDWLKQDEGQDAHPVLQMGAILRIQQHRQAGQGLAAEEMRAQAAITIPARAVEEDHANKQADNQAARDLQQHQAKQQISDASKRAEMTHAQILQGATTPSP